MLLANMQQGMKLLMIQIIAYFQKREKGFVKLFICPHLNNVFICFPKEEARIIKNNHCKERAFALVT